MPLRNRNIQKSIMAYIRGLLTTPPSGSGINAQHVYDEDSLVAVNKKTLTLQRPFVFLLMTYMKPQPSILPMLVVEVPEILREPFELGNRNGRVTDLTINVFGRQRGELEDFGSFLQDNFGPTFPVYDYTASTSGSFSENAEVDPSIFVKQHIPSSDAVRQEGSLDLWQLVDIRFRTKS